MVSSKPMGGARNLRGANEKQEPEYRGKFIVSCLHRRIKELKLGDQGRAPN